MGAVDLTLHTDVAWICLVANSAREDIQEAEKVIEQGTVDFQGRTTEFAVTPRLMEISQPLRRKQGSASLPRLDLSKVGGSSSGGGGTGSVRKVRYFFFSCSQFVPTRVRMEEGHI